MQPWPYPDRVGEKQLKPRTRAALQSMDSNDSYVLESIPQPQTQSENDCKEAELQGKR